MINKNKLPFKQLHDSYSQERTGSKSRKKKGGISFSNTAPSSSAQFSKELKRIIRNGEELKYSDCVFDYEVNLRDYEFNQKVRFHRCVFKKGINCLNTTFNQLVDFYQSTFEENQIFHLTDFLNISIFSETKFEKAAIFRHNKVSENTYISFEKSHFENGLDISNSNFWCTLQVYDIKIKNEIPDLISLSFYAANNISVIKSALEKRENKVNLFDSIEKDNLHSHLFHKFKSYLPFSSDIGPSGYAFDNYIKNAIDSGFQKEDDKVFMLALFKSTFKGLRESYRRIKQEFRKNENHIEALDFHHHEMTLFRKELNYKKTDDFISRIDKRRNQFILFLNKHSNNYKRSWSIGVIFTLITASIFYYLPVVYCQFTGQTSILSDTECNLEINGFLRFINPLEFKYIPFHIKESSFVLWFFIGKIMIGYGYYQTIQAFRKYGKN
ncbi:hypothetical protein [Flavicella sediminum]|uniref:hypothetical protein n=1 Tax=Flavicella sediminum TaxID=2585141 RepID=UPI0011239E61|nr:hypothetical protein [Flavicella sediminum]